MTRHTECAMGVSYHELHNEVTDIEGSGMGSEIQQYIDYS